MANESIRIRTTPGVSNNIRIKLEQDFDFLEILSLKISQEDLYQTFCANYGVVVGRVIVNKGFGIPNAKVSVFIPITDEDQKNVLIKDLYPFKTPYQKNKNYRYNLLLSKATCLLNKAVGNFPVKEEFLDNDTVLEVFDKYYKYTTKTNHAGDFMIFGVPVGQHTIHMDVDLSDIGAVSVRPYDMIAGGFPEKLFESKVEFKTSKNLDSLPQIKTGNIGVDVIPFWGDAETCEIGITRVDFDTNFEITTTALFFGSVFTDSEDEYLKQRCNPTRSLGEQPQLRAAPGRIEMIRANQYDIDEWVNNQNIKALDLEEFSIDGGDLINDDGVFAFPLPMNIGHVITAENGDLIPSIDPSVGVATKGMYRFKMNLVGASTDAELRTATMFFPSLGVDFGGTPGMLDTGQGAQANGTQDQRWTNDITQYDTTPGTGFPNSRINLDFHTFEWKQLYTIAHFIKKYKRGVSRWRFIGIKNTDNDKSQNLFPFSNMIWKNNILYDIISVILVIIKFVIDFFIILIGLCFGPILGLNVHIKVFGSCILCIDECFVLLICPFTWIGRLIGAIDLECNDNKYTIDLPNCNSEGCDGNFICVHKTPCSDAQICFILCIGLKITGAGPQTNKCLEVWDKWLCCVKVEIAEELNVMRRVFMDAWVFGTAYLFKFVYGEDDGNQKFCGPGSQKGNSDNYEDNDCCLDQPVGSCHRCVLRGPQKTAWRGGVSGFWKGSFDAYHYNYQNDTITHAVNNPGCGFGAYDIDDIVYCNSLASTKIVSLGRIEMCQETLEGIEDAINANKALKNYIQRGTFFTGTGDYIGPTFNESGWDVGYWVKFLGETSYKSPRDVIQYFADNHVGPICALSELFTSDNNDCHDQELKPTSNTNSANGYPFLVFKEVSKIHNRIILTDDPNPNIDGTFFGGSGFSGRNPMYDWVNDILNSPGNTGPTYGGFAPDWHLANRFSPCGDPGCTGYQQIAAGSLPETGNWAPYISTYSNLVGYNLYTNSDSWDKTIAFSSRGQNQNVRSDIPYYFFGVNPGKTAINKLRKDYISKYNL